MNNCCVCDAIVTERFFVCANACKCIIHSKCAGVGSDVVFDVIANISNFSWTCNVCVNRLDDHDAKIASIIADLGKLNMLVQPSSHRASKKDNSNVITGTNIPTQLQYPLSSLSSSSLPSSSSSSNRNSIQKNKNNDKNINKEKLPVDTNTNGTGPSANTRSKNTINNTVTVVANNITPEFVADLSTQSTNNNNKNNNNNNNNHIIGNNVIIGSSVEIDNVICAADARKWFFISRLQNSTTEAELMQYIKGKFDIDDFRCLKLNHRYETEYASFKVNISADIVHRLLDGNMWPAGVLVKEFVQPGFYRQFFQRRRRKHVPV